MRHVEMADGKPVANGCPRAFAHERKVDFLFRSEALFLGGDQEGAVEKRQEAGGDLMCARHGSVPGSRRLAAVIKLWAISTIFLFWFMAVRRMSA